MEQVLLFIDGVYLLIVQDRTFSKKHASVAFDLIFRQFVAGGLVIQNAVNNKSQINYGKSDYKKRNCSLDIFRV